MQKIRKILRVISEKTALPTNQLLPTRPILCIQQAISSYWPIICAFNKLFHVLKIEKKFSGFFLDLRSYVKQLKTDHESSQKQKRQYSRQAERSRASFPSLSIGPATPGRHDPLFLHSKKKKNKTKEKRKCFNAERAVTKVKTLPF